MFAYIEGSFWFMEVNMSRWFLLFVVAILNGCGGGGGDAGPAPAVPVPVVAPAPAPVVEALPVYLFLGQSNMVGGQGEQALLPPRLLPALSDQVFTDTWKQMQVGNYQPLGFGPELSFAARKPGVGIVKFAVNGTSLATDWLPNLLSQAISHAQAAAASQPVRFAGAFWMQGESDASSADQADAYAANLRTLVARLRTELNAPKMTFTVCRINPPTNAPWLFRDTVRTAQEDPGIDNYQMMDCDGLPLGPDKLHFTTQGIVQMGELFAGVTE